MRKIAFIISTLAITLVIASCASSHQNNDITYDESYGDSDIIDGYPNEETPYFTENFNTYKATRTVFTDLINTKLELKPIWEKAYLEGRATITAKPHFYASDSLFLDAKGMTINSVSMNGKSVYYSYKNDELRIKLDRSYTRNETYSITIDYVAKPNERKTTVGNAVTSDKGLYFINPKNEKEGFMPQIWTQGETESNSVWFPTIDSPNMKSAQEIYITVADKYKTLSNGKLVSSTKNSDGTRTDYWKQEKAHSIYLFMIAVGEFSVVEDTYTRKDGTQMTVNYYVEPEWEKQAKAIFGKTPKMIAYFSNLLGVEFPWDKYSQIIVREYVSGAMENTGAVVFGDFCYKTDQELADENDESIVAHELFHHWFGNLVTAESWSNLPLNESFANYSQYLWDEHEYGKDVAQFNKDEDLIGYYNSGVHRNPIWYYYNHADDMFDAVSYNKGGAILHQLRSYLGDEVFFAGLNLYLTRHAYKTAEMANLRMALEEVSGEDLNWYFNQWFFGADDPTMNISFSYNYEKTKFNLCLEQTQSSPLVVPMTILYVDDAGEHIEKFKTFKTNDTLTFAIKGKLQAIVIDPNKDLLGEYTFFSTPEFSIKQFEIATNYRSKKEAIASYLQRSSSKIDTAFIAKALQDAFYGTQLAVLDEVETSMAMQGKNIESYISAAKLRQLALNGTHFQVRQTALKLFCEITTISNENKLQLLNELSLKEKSLKVLSSVLEYYLKLSPETATTQIEKFKTYNSSDINYQIGAYYLENNTPGQLSFFKKMYEKSSIREKIGVLMFYGYYVRSQSVDEIDAYMDIMTANYNSAGEYRFYLTDLVSDIDNVLSEQEKEVQKQLSKEPKNTLLMSLFTKIQNARKKCNSLIGKEKASE